MIGSMCHKELMLIKPVFCASVFLPLLILSGDKFWISAKSMQCLSWFNPRKTMSFNDVANVSTEVNNYKIHFWYVSRKKP